MGTEKLTPLSLVSFLRDMDKKRKTRLDTTGRSDWSGF